MKKELVDKLADVLMIVTDRDMEIRNAIPMGCHHEAIPVMVFMGSIKCRFLVLDGEISTHNVVQLHELLTQRIKEASLKAVQDKHDKIRNQLDELNSRNTYWDGFTEGIRQGKEEKEAELYEMKMIAFLRKLFGKDAV